MADSSIKIAVASHKPYWMPSDLLYLPVQVGAVGKESIPGFQRDDEGENISEKNQRYSELTALYWAWKNLEADYVGLAHYRRHFKGNGERGLLAETEARGLLADSPIILPKRRHYVIETVESHYGHTFDEGHIDVLRDVISEREPRYSEQFNACMKRRSVHILNMLIMRRDVFDSWCGWLFPLLADVEMRIDFSGMTQFEQRLIGRLSELLLDTWIAENGISFKDIPMVSLEPVNWFKKGSSFLLAKYGRKKYTESF